MPQIYSIYVYYDGKIRDNEVIKKFHKVKGIYTDLSSIFDSFKNDIRRYEENLISTSIMPNTNISKVNLNELDPSYMYTKLLKEVLLKLDFDEHQRKYFVALSRGFYGNNTKILQTVDEFERDYQSDASIRWYPRSRFFLRDLHQKIDELRLKSNGQISFIVYRGQAMTNDDFEKLYKGKGGLFSFDSFLSTSIDKTVSLMYVESNADNPNMKGILFVMEIDTVNANVPFISLDGISYYDDEKEILFSMQTIFRIGDVKKIDNKVWQVDLTLTSDDDQQFRILTEHMREDLGRGTSWQQLDLLMYTMEQFKKGEEIHQMLLNIAPVNDDDDEITILYQLLGILKCDHSNAIPNYKEALKIIEKSEFSDHVDLAIVFNNIGAVYVIIGDYSSALSYYEKGFNIRLSTEDQNYIDLPDNYNNTALVYEKIGGYSDAISSHKEALKVKCKYLPENNFALTKSYNVISLLLQKMQKYLDAFSYYKKALEIWKKLSPMNHPKSAKTYNNIGAFHEAMTEFSSALDCYYQAARILEISQPLNQPLLATVKNNIGSTYEKMTDNSTALLYYKKVLELWQESLSENHPNLASAYNNIAGAH
ncbi:unnamed protein product [Rotaria sp. Silwood2]|nr:unnamed protein product [Rotaria sp. Silwood2]